MQRVTVIDSHTGGEPTRLVLDGGPDLGDGPLVQRARRFREAQDAFRSAMVNEPRGSDVLVGALLLEPADPDCVAGVIFFNNVGSLGMCGHGLIGVMVSLAHLGRIQPGTHHMETPVGRVTATLHEDQSVSFENVPSHRAAHAVPVDVPGVGRMRGDVAYGGNWFFLADAPGPDLTREDAGVLVELGGRIRKAVNAGGFPQVDHVELIGPPKGPGADSRNFVLCPGNAYDRSPCGTGTSAKLACLAADGTLAEGEPWVQESLLGSRFIGRYRWLDRRQGTILPTITGTAHVTGEATLLLDERDPFCWGLR
jgi:proline racemase